MTGTVIIPGNLQWLGLAPETTYGTPAVNPTSFIPVDSPVWHAITSLMTDTGLRGSMAGEFNQLTGLRYDQVTFKTNFYLDSIYQIVRSLLGLADVISGTGDPYTHKTSLLNGNNGQPTGTTVFMGDGNGKAWVMPGAICSDIKITITTDGFATADVTFVGLPATSITAPTNTPTTQRPMPGWNSTVVISGTPRSTYSQVELELKRTAEMLPTISGSQSPVAIYAGEVTVAGTLTAVFQGADDIDLAGYLANTQPAITITVHPITDAVHGIAFQLSKVAYDDAAPSGTDKWVELKTTIKGLANATDVAGGGGLSPVLVTLTSAASAALA